MLRHVGLLALAAGLASAQNLHAPPGWIVCIPALAILYILHRSRRRSTAAESPPALAIVISIVAALSFGIGLGVGEARIAAIDGGALGGVGTEEVLVRGYVTGSAWREGGEVLVPVSTPDGRVMVVTAESELEDSPPIGRLIEAEGSLLATSEHDDFLRARLRRIGISHQLQASHVGLLEGWRGGLAGALDRARIKAERALSAGLDGPQADLIRGFVLGGDDRIDQALEDDFRRTGLSHLIAVSGQNVMLLAALAGVVFGLAGLRLRPRLALTIVLIALYVPITGAGASIQRAAVMGSAGILVTALGRPADRIYVLALALAATLTINPLFTGDVGWQLSFLAVAGIGLWGARIRSLLLDRRPLSALPARVGRPAAEAVGITVAATLATAPLIAATFERISVVSLLANVAVAPAVAPVMWLGMLASLLGQLSYWPPIPGLLAAIGFLASLPVEYIATIARRFSGLSWSEAEVSAQSLWATALTYGSLFAGFTALLLAAGRRKGLVVSGSGVAAIALVLVVLLLIATDAFPGAPRDPPTRSGLRMVSLDVGQGDATLLQPSRGLPILVDAGPAEAAVADQLDDLGIDRLGAMLITHDQSDHAGGTAEILSRLEVDVLGSPRPMRSLDDVAASQGVDVARLVAGRSLRSGSLKFEVLWPSGTSPGSDDPNESSLVLLAGEGGVRILLTGDAEQEMTHLRPGRVDVLKVAHHGSSDAGLESLLEASDPAVATISSGIDNTYGHPAAETVNALGAAEICTLRTDEDGMVVIDFPSAGIVIWAEETPSLAGRSGCSGGDPGPRRIRGRSPP